ncbi:MAG: polyprenol monophosphomannose synthase [Candidatus Aminicenantia bacterium]
MLEKILVIIPTYNERENIKTLVKQIFYYTRGNNVEILFVDDGSPDGTGEEIKKLQRVDDRIKLIEREKKSGLGRAYVEGFLYAIKNGYSLVFEMDADLSHRPEYLPAFIESAKDYDLIIGSRYVEGGGVKNWGFVRKFISKAGNLYSRLILGFPIRDSTSGFKCFKIDVLKAIKPETLSSQGYSFQIENVLRAWRKGFRIKECPIIFYEREKGKSKMSKKIVFEAILKVLELKLKSIKIFPLRDKIKSQEAIK